jgi:predicted metal-dependent phosphoesterase TrpH
MTRSFIDLHCHTSASFDSLADPAKVVRAAASRGLTHVIVTDHDRIDGALLARDTAPAGMTIIVGEEIKTAEGDLIGAFLESAVPPGMSAAETVAAVREQGGLVGIPHPFDRMRGSVRTEARMSALAPLVDWIEVHNARLIGSGNEQAAAFAREHTMAGVAVSDAHSVLEVGVAYTALDGDPSTPAGLLAALPGAEIVPGRATYVVRLWTPIAKAVNRIRGNGRVLPGAQV